MTVAAGAGDISSSGSGDNQTAALIPSDAQVITMGARVIAPEAAEKVLEHWLASEFEGGRSTPKVEKMKEVDARYRGYRDAV